MIQKYLVLGLAGAVALAGIGAAVQTARLGRAKAKVVVLEQRVDARDATIAAQNKGLTDLRREIAASEIRIKDAGDRIEALKADLSAARAKRNATVEKDYALPECQILLATDLAAVCPAHAQRVRSAGGLPGS